MRQTVMPTPDQEAALILEARKFLRRGTPHVIWKKTVNEYQAGFGKKVRLELTNQLQLRIVDPKTGEALEVPAEGPAAP